MAAGRVLARAGADAAWCERAADLLGTALGPGLETVTARLSLARSLEEARESAARISSLVAAVRSYSQLDRAPVQAVDVVAGLESTLAVLGHRTPGGDLGRADWPADLPTVEGAAAPLNQVWTNLIANALDAMGGDGTLRLTVRAEADGGLVVEVADTGPGMTPDVARHAFDPFFTTKDVGRGTGLGLDTARRVVEGHGGRIGIDSGPGGTAVRVRLPARQPGPASAPEPPAHPVEVAAPPPSGGT